MTELLKTGFLLLCSFSVLNAQKTIPTDENLMVEAEFGEHMAIGVSVNSENKIFVSFPGHDGDGHLALARVEAGELIPYPNISWNETGEYEHHFLRIQDLYVDSEDKLWVLDSKPSPGGNIFGDGAGENLGQFKLVKINTRTDEVEKVFLFEDLDKSVSALNDVRVDTEKKLAYFSDPGQAAVVVLDLTDGASRTVLKNSEYTTADDMVPTYDGVEMRTKDGNGFSSHVNGIALTHDFRYFYFKPINKKELYRIETRFLADETLAEDALRAKVEAVGKPGITHGLIADRHGNVYLTTSESYSVSYLTPAGEIRKLVQDPRLLWPDSLGIGSDGYLYFSCAQIQRLPQWNGGKDKTDYPYRLYKVKLPVP